MQDKIKLSKHEVANPLAMTQKQNLNLKSNKRNKKIIVFSTLENKIREMHSGMHSK